MVVYRRNSKYFDGNNLQMESTVQTGASTEALTNIGVKSRRSLSGIHHFTSAYILRLVSRTGLG